MAMVLSTKKRLRHVLHSDGLQRKMSAKKKLSKVCLNLILTTLPEKWCIDLNLDWKFYVLDAEKSAYLHLNAQATNDDIIPFEHFDFIKEK